MSRSNKVFIAILTALAGIAGAILGEYLGATSILNAASGPPGGYNSPAWIWGPPAPPPPPVSIPADPLIVIAYAIAAMSIVFVILYAFANRPVR